MSTYEHARRLGAGAVLTDGRDRYLISDWSPATRKVYGWHYNRNRRGAYVELPADLMES